MLRAYLRDMVVLEIKIGTTKDYLELKYCDGKIIDPLAKIDRAFASMCLGASTAELAEALVDWRQTPDPDLPPASGGFDQSPLDLLYAVPESEFE